MNDSGSRPVKQFLPVLEAAERDRKLGRAWKARDRLQGALATDGTDERVLGMLGDVLWEMGDHPAAGAAWYLTSRRDERFETAVEALRERNGYRAANIAAALPLRNPIDEYCPAAQERLRPLLAQAAEEGYETRRRESTPEATSDFDELDTLGDKLLRFIFVPYCFVGFVFVWIWGFVSLMKTIW